jgi:hypothetical protein
MRVCVLSRTLKMTGIANRFHQNFVKFYICKPKSTGRGSLIKKQTVCIPIVCKYFIFVVSMEMREKNQSHVAVRYLRYSPVFTLLRRRHDFLPDFFSIEMTETEKNKKSGTFVGYFVVILCTCHFDNFEFFSLITLITNITLRSNCQQI